MMHVIEIGLGFVMSTLMLSLSLMMMMRKTSFWKLSGFLGELLEASWSNFFELWTIVWLFSELRRISLNDQADL